MYIACNVKYESYVMHVRCNAAFRSVILMSDWIHVSSEDGKSILPVALKRLFHPFQSYLIVLIVCQNVGHILLITLTTFLKKIMRVLKDIDVSNFG